LHRDLILPKTMFDYIARLEQLKVAPPADV